MIKALGVIPARYGSTRFEGKVLADILGKPMLQHVWERVKEARLLDEVIIACDDQRIIEAAEGFGAKAVFTSKNHDCGSDRIAEVVNPIEVKVIINIQGDEPLVHPTMIDSLARTLLEDQSLCMATLIKRIDDPAEAGDPNIVKVVKDKDDFALYFSRAAIPHPAREPKEEPVYFKHIGIYAYTKDFLFTYKNFPAADYENVERLEQLRVLKQGYRIKLIETKFETIGVDTPEDLERVSNYLRQEGSNAPSESL
ncbi:3-deoxy-manno-octulosonate cytidylyltransferase [Candidatus Omnitrophota bacterium]